MATIVIEEGVTAVMEGAGGTNFLYIFVYETKRSKNQNAVFFWNTHGTAPWGTSTWV